MELVLFGTTLEKNEMTTPAENRVNEEDAITLSKIKEVLPFATLLVGVALSWASTKSDLRVLTNEVQNTNKILTEYVQETKAIKETISAMKITDTIMSSRLDAAINNNNK
jgi:hypothetical protein